MTMSSSEWLSAHLFYGVPWANFLTQAIRPFIDDLVARSLISQYFFIRYWERGPHIRLRLKGDPSILQEYVKPLLEATFNDYFAAHPSKRPLPEWDPSIAPSQRWLPNNTVQYIPYEPEVARYGGLPGVKIAEAHFESSSRAVLSAMTMDGWTYQKALGTAIHMHLGFAHACGWTLANTAAFFTYFSELWFPAVLQMNSTLDKTETLTNQRIHDAFSDAFDKQETSLLTIHESLWQTMTNRLSFTTSWLDQWREEVQDIVNKLACAYYHDKDIIVPFEEENPERALWPILISYVHMTNNRLGVLNQDEAFLGYLISRCTQQLSGTLEKNKSNFCKDEATPSF